MNIDSEPFLSPDHNKWGLTDVKTDSQLFDQDPDYLVESKPLLCHTCNVQFCSFSQFHHHHIQHVAQPSVVLTPVAQHPTAAKTGQKRPGPKSKTSKEYSPIKLTFKRLSVCQESAFTVVNKKRGRPKSKRAMDEMIPDGRLGGAASRPQTPSPTPSEVLRPEGFLAPESMDSPAREVEGVDTQLAMNGNGLLEPYSDTRGQEDSGTSSSGDGEPDSEPPQQFPAPEPPAEQPVVNGSADDANDTDKQLEQEGSDSGYEKDGSEKDYPGLDKADSTPTSTPPPSLSPSLGGGLMVLAPTNGTAPADGPSPARPSLTIKSPAALMAQPLGGAVSLLNISSGSFPLANSYLDPQSTFMMEACEVCGERSADLEAHRAAAGHFKCHVSPDCAVVLFTSAGELANHQQVTHGLSTQPPQASLHQLQQQVQRLPVPFGMPAVPPIGTPPLRTSPLGTPPHPSASISPSFRVPGGITLIQARPFAMQTSPSTIRPDGSPVTPPTPPQTKSPVAPPPPNLPLGLSRSISISPAVSARPAQKRAPSPPAAAAPKRSRSDSPDCELVGVEQKLPALPSGISLTVRGSSKETSGVANILASRGITVTPAAKTASPSRAPATPSPLTTLNLSSAVSIVPASQSRSQFAVPQGRSVGRQATVTSRTPTVDLTTTPDTPPARRRQPRFTCQVCDKVFTSQETLNQHLTTHRSPSKLPYKCTMCNAQYPTHHALLQHKNTYHKEAQGSEMALPVIDLRNSNTVQKLASLGVRHCVVISQLTNSSSGVFGLPIVALDNARNPAVCNLGALGASNVLSLGPAKSLR